MFQSPTREQFTLKSTASGSICSPPLHAAHYAQKWAPLITSLLDVSAKADMGHPLIVWMPDGM
eukprot:scaffold215689_cov23-Tisochrysis_lutea.AAC.1